MPELRTGYGFGSVYVTVIDLAGAEVFPTTNFPLAGSGDDPELVIPLDVRGYRIELLFVGHDNPASGGFSELQIFAVAQATV